MTLTCVHLHVCVESSIITHMVHSVFLELLLRRMAEASDSVQVVIRKRSFDAAFKLSVVYYVEQKTNKGGARKYGVDTKYVCGWKKQTDDLETLPQEKRSSGGGRKAALSGMENILLVLTDETRVENEKKTCHCIL